MEQNFGEGNRNQSSFLIKHKLLLIFIIISLLFSTSLKAHAQTQKPYNFNLSINTSINGGTNIIQSGGEVKIVTTIQNKALDQNEDASASPNNTTVKIYRLAISENLPIDTIDKSRFVGADFGGDICNILKSMLPSLPYNFGNDLETCYELPGASKTFEDGIGANNNTTINVVDVIHESESNKQICYVSAVNFVNALSASANFWRSSEISCIAIGKSPYFNVIGGSIYGSGSILGFTTKINNVSYGSWVDFGIISNKNIESVASGASLAKGSESNNWCKKHTSLTVANNLCNIKTEVTGNSGIYRNTTTIDRIYNNYAGNNTANKEQGGGYKYSVDLSRDFTTFGDKNYRTVIKNPEILTTTTPLYRYTYIDGDAEIATNQDLKKGLTHVIYATGKITIVSDMLYDKEGKIISPSYIPQYIVIADGGIDIKGQVAEIDAWLITRNSILNTCSDYIGNDKQIRIGEGSCENQLIINGPVFAKQAILNRTYGAEQSDTNQDLISEPAEIFDINASSYLWSYAQAQNHSSIKTVYTKKLAPRY